MNTQMAYLIGMILGNGEVQRKSDTTTITVELPHKNLIDDEGREVSVYVKSSLADIRGIVEPLIGYSLPISQTKRATQFSFTMPNADYTMREILRFIGNGVHHSTMTMNDELFGMKTDEKKELLRGIADVTGYIRKSNIAFGQDGCHRVYIEIPGNWQMVIDIANMLKDLDSFDLKLYCIYDQIGYNDASKMSCINELFKISRRHQKRSKSTITRIYRSYSNVKNNISWK